MVDPPPGAIAGTNIDAFLVKIHPSGGSFDYAIRLGGNGNDRGTGVAVNGFGAAYVTGESALGATPNTFPLLAALQPIP